MEVTPDMQSTLTHGKKRQHLCGKVLVLCLAELMCWWLISQFHFKFHLSFKLSSLGYFMFHLENIKSHLLNFGF